MKTLKLKFTLIYNFALPALLLNCIGIVILNLYNNYHIPMADLSWLEAFKDFSILIASFLLASSIPKMGYKKSILIGSLFEIIACVLLALFPSFLISQLFFVLVGIGFALIKVAIYSSVELITNNDTEHASLISILEGFFMASLLAGFWIFGYFMKHGEWLTVFWILAIGAAIGLLLLLVTPFDESKLIKAEQEHEKKITSKKHYLKQCIINYFKSYLDLFRLLQQKSIWIFLILIFSYLFIEQGFINWLPTFNNHILNISSAASVEIASLLFASFALGRIVFGAIMRYVHWSKILIICIVSAIIVLLLSLYMAFHAYLVTQETQKITHWAQFPIAAYLLPLVAFFVAPIYPTLNSSILSKQTTHAQSSMTVWILIFSALGGAVGARVLGVLFSHFGGLIAMGILITPLFILLILTIPYYILLKK